MCALNLFCHVDKRYQSATALSHRVFNQVHDLAEAIVGDIVPTQFSGVSEADKNAQEAHAMQTIGTQHLRAHSSLGLEVTSLWQEYAAGATLEARFVKQLDKVEMLIQAFEYEVEQPVLQLDGFFSWVAASKKVDDPSLLALLDEIQSRRRALGRASSAPFAAVPELGAAVAPTTAASD